MLNLELFFGTKLNRLALKSIKIVLQTVLLV